MQMKKLESLLPFIGKFFAIRKRSD